MNFIWRVTALSGLAWSLLCWEVAFVVCCCILQCHLRELLLFSHCRLLNYIKDLFFAIRIQC